MRLTVRLWATSRDLAALITDGSQRQPSRRKLAVIRAGVMVSFVLLSPLALVLGPRFRRPTAFSALDARVRQIWPTSVCLFLYEREVAFGNFEAALVVTRALPGKLEMTILKEVDCLVALGRRAEAIALLERNLDLDGWRGKLRRRLRELGGRHLRALR